MGDNKDFLLAIVLSVAVLVGWQFFVGGPQVEQQKAKQQQAQQKQAPKTPGATQVPTPGTSTVPTPGGAPQPGVSVSTPPAPGQSPTASRTKALKASQRLKIETPKLQGSINLKGARIDDLLLSDYRETVKPDSPNITLFSPSGAPNPYYAEYGWTSAPGTKIKLPNANTTWQAPGNAVLKPGSPVTLSYDNGEGFTFQRHITVDENYLFTITQSVKNTTDKAISLFPYALISRHGTPKTEDFFVLHEGLVGVHGKDGLTETDYDDIVEDKLATYKMTGGWAGIVDKYWGAVLIPNQTTPVTTRYSASKSNNLDLYQVDYLGGAVTIPANGEGKAQAQLFAGAKVVSVIDGYAEKYKILNFDLLIDWGWFYFITKPMFLLLDFFFKLVGNFGVAILLVTVLIKLVFFPLANKSYVSMSKMKKLQPEMVKMKERYGDDKVKQQQAMMELYKKEKVNPMSGCLPIAIQIPVFFALYKVLFGTIEMRHAPFFGWIQDLAAPDPTSIFNLFGLIPWDPPLFLMIGIWPLIMGISMFVQMRLNPTPTDAMQAQIFAWMPVFFTFLLATFPAGLVIYWAWNNILSIAQQWVIMSRQGVKVDLLGNIASSLPKFGKKPNE